MKMRSLAIQIALAVSVSSAQAGEISDAECDSVVKAFINVSEANVQSTESLVEAQRGFLSILVEFGPDTRDLDRLTGITSGLDMDAGEIDGPIVGAGILALRQVCPNSFP